MTKVWRECESEVVSDLGGGRMGGVGQYNERKIFRDDCTAQAHVVG